MKSENREIDSRPVKPGPRNPGPSEQQQAVLLDVTERGGTNRDAAAMAGIAESTLYNWLAHPDFGDFGDAYTHARANGRFRSIKIIADSEDWRAHAWLLERKDPEYWGKGDTDPNQLAEKLSAFLQGRADADR
jgi:hypothetical protein